MNWANMTNLHWIAYGVIAFGALCSLVVGPIIILKANQIESQKTKKEIIARQDLNTTKILQELAKRNESLKEQLEKRYPFGYVLFGGTGEGVYIPFYRDGLQVDANWETTEIKLDRERQLASVKIPTPTWKQDSGPKVYINVRDSANWTGKYTLGKPVRITLVKVIGQPEMFFEVIDDNPKSPICLIGFKK